MSKIKLLVIDDHERIRENVAEILRLASYEVFTAENGTTGLALAIKEKPDLIICDITMPELDGYGVLEGIRSNPATAFVPFIFLTARTERGDQRKGMELGADDYISKPFDDSEILNAIQARLKKYDTLQNVYSSDSNGSKELLKDLHSAGLLDLSMNKYDTEVFYKKQDIYKEGKIPRYIYYLTRGKIKTFRINNDGKEYITNLYSEGDFIGYMPMLENNIYEETAEVLEDAEIVKIPGDDFLKAFYSDINVAARFIKLITQNVQEKEQRLMSLAYGSIRKRVAKALLDINIKFNKENEDSIKITREDIAQYVGTATESVIRTLSDLKSEKLIDISDGRIVIMDIEKLTALTL